VHIHSNFPTVSYLRYVLNHARKIHVEFYDYITMLLAAQWSNHLGSNRGVKARLQIDSVSSKKIVKDMIVTFQRVS
jgi:hypothetical protein